MIRPLDVLLVLILLVSGPGIGHTQVSNSSDSRPNILLIIADDLGYADVGAYGSDIETPNIDSLAAEGMLFTHFHTGPSCGPTRAMLMSGNNNHVAGMARQLSIGLLGSPVRGYENSLSDRIVPFPRLLQSAGYDTYMTGKWHLGLTAEKSPHAAGFTRSFALLDGGSSHFDARGLREGGNAFREDEELVPYPTGRFSSELYTNRLISFIDEGKNNEKPFFAFASYTAPHWPLQVPDEYLDLYAGYYDDGYDSLRERRFRSLQEAGIIPLTSKLPPRNEAITPWVNLGADQQRYESRKMELYAALLDNLDDNIGRLLAYLRENDLYDNTLIVFMSDNGADGGDFYDRGPYKEHLRSQFDNSYEKMGTSESFVAYDAPWAEAATAPFHRYKGYVRQGGIVSAMIAAGPGVAARGVIDSTYLTVMDIAPTFLEVAGAEYPIDDAIEPMVGESMVAFLSGRADAVHDADYVTTMFHRSRAYLRQGDWKISNLDAPFDESSFELFNVREDPAELRNLGHDEPEKLAELIALWRKERKRFGIILPEDL